MRKLSLFKEGIIIEWNSPSKINEAGLMKMMFIFLKFIYIGSSAAFNKISHDLIRWNYQTA